MSTASAKQATPPKGRPTPKQKRPAATAEVTAARRRSVLGLIACIVAAFAHIVVTLYVMMLTGGETSSVLTTLALAPMVTVVFVPHARRHGWQRWLVLGALAFVVYSDLLVPTLLIAETWILHRFWIVEGGIQIPGRGGSAEHA